MSAVQGPMPWTAVSTACASSAGLVTSAGRSSSPRSTAFAIALSVRILGAESPARASLAARARMTTPVFRFAPSPNGYLHLGHALSALINFEMARAMGGRFLLRIEDIDATRCRPHYEEAIYEDLDWLGLRWEEPVRRQSAH